MCLRDSGAAVAAAARQRSIFFRQQCFIRIFALLLTSFPPEQIQPPCLLCVTTTHVPSSSCPRFKQHNENVPPTPSPLAFSFFRGALLFDAAWGWRNFPRMQRRRGVRRRCMCLCRPYPMLYTPTRFPTGPNTKRSLAFVIALLHTLQVDTSNLHHSFVHNHNVIQHSTVFLVKRRRVGGQRERSSNKGAKTVRSRPGRSARTSHPLAQHRDRVAQLAARALGAEEAQAL